MLRLHEVLLACVSLHREQHNASFETLLWLPVCNMAKVFKLLEELTGHFGSGQIFLGKWKIEVCYVCTSKNSTVGSWVLFLQLFVCSFVRPQKQMNSE